MLGGRAVDEGGHVIAPGGKGDRCNGDIVSIHFVDAAESQEQLRNTWVRESPRIWLGHEPNNPCRFERAKKKELVEATHLWEACGHWEIALER